MKNTKRILSAILFIFMVAAYISTPVLASSPFATRIVPSSVVSGSEFEIAIEAGGCGAFGQVIETLPVGFTYLRCASRDVGVEQTGNVIKFSFLSDTADFTYAVRAPRVAESTTFAFYGRVMDEDRISQSVEDDGVMVLAPSGMRMLPSLVTWGNEFDVAIETVGCGAFGQVVEILPEGFIYVSSSLPEEQVEQTGDMIKFSFIGGEARFSYAVRAPEVAAGTTYTLRGEVLDEDRIVFTIGDSDVTIMSPPERVRTATGTGVATFSSSLGNIDDLEAMAEGALPDVGMPDGITFPHGLFSFNVAGISPGATVTVDLALPVEISTGIQYWKWHEIQGWVDMTPFLEDDDGDNKLTLVLTDGGLGDADGKANGTIVDPGGPALMVEKREVHRVYGALPQTADFSSSYLHISPRQVVPNQQVEISVNIANHGSNRDAHTASLYIDGILVDSQVVSISPGACQSVVFRTSKTSPGNYDVCLEGQRGQFTIVAPSATSSSTANDLGAGGIVTVFLVLVIALAFLFVKTQKGTGR